ncbi:HU family DNA-binding protein [bacterium 210917-DFI.7.65]|nr:HU family DNA-binding protein [bacterium 210917-DFI.7.65]
MIHRRTKTMNKQELISAAAEKTGFSKKDTEATVTAVLETIISALEDNEKVQLVGFGSFEVKERAARIGRNPKTKEAIEIPASKAPVFKPSKALKDILAK